MEDNPNDEALTLRALRKAGVANGVVVARDGAEALELLLGPDETARHGGATLPCVVILDLNLPKVGGLEVLERLRQGEQTRWLPVVVLTSSDEQRDLLESYRLGVNAYVHKPVRFGEFVAAVQQLGLFWLLVNEPPPELRS